MIKDEGIAELVGLALENWRFARVFERALAKMAPADVKKFSNSHSFFLKRTSQALDKFGIRVVSLEGKAYSEGQPVSVVNSDEFEGLDHLIIEQMVEPILMGPDGVYRAGSVRLKALETK